MLCISVNDYLCGCIDDGLCVRQLFLYGEYSCTVTSFDRTEVHDIYSTVMYGCSVIPW